MPDIVTSKIFVDGEKGITAAKLNQIMSQATIQPEFYSSKAASSTLDPTDQLLELKGTGIYARITAQQLIDSISASLAVFVPTGAILDFGGSTAPTGFLLCNGASYSTSTYSSLFAAIGYAFGGSGANFNVPDLRGRILVGAGQGAGLTNRTLAATGGEEGHALVAAENAPHTHTINITDPGHSHTMVLTGASNAQAGAGITYMWPSGSYGTSTNPTGISASATSQGSGTAHNNMQPFAVLNKIIKT